MDFRTNFVVCSGCRTPKSGQYTIWDWIIKSTRNQIRIGLLFVLLCLHFELWQFLQISCNHGFLSSFLKWNGLYHTWTVEVPTEGSKTLYPIDIDIRFYTCLDGQNRGRGRECVHKTQKKWRRLLCTTPWANLFVRRDIFYKLYLSQF